MLITDKSNLIMSYISSALQNAKRTYRDILNYSDSVADRHILISRNFFSSIRPQRRRSVNMGSE